MRLENIGTLCKRVRRPSSGQAEAKQQPTQRQPLFQKEGGVKRDLRMQFDDNFRLLSTASGSLERESVSLSLLVAQAGPLLGRAAFCWGRLLLSTSLPVGVS